MRRPRPLPASLTGAPFTTADARGAGVGNRRLQRPDVDRPFHGIASAVPIDDAVTRLRAYGLRLLDGQVLSHTTALILWGVPVPDERSEVVHVSVAFPRTPPRAEGVRGHSLQRIAPTMLFGMPVSGPAAAWYEAAAILAVPHLVAAGDALLTGRRRNGVRGPGLVTLAELVAASMTRVRAGGAARARRALELVRAGIDSPRETGLRLLLGRHRLPEPAVDQAIAVAGAVVLHADLAYPAARIALEYDGDVHRTDRRRWMADIRRRELMEDAGWRVVRVVAEDLADPGPLIARLRRLLRR
jgi:very-short-patch-repair endonuclease